MKIANVKGMIAKGMMAAMVAGTLLAVSPAKAEAQQFAVGVQVGQPAYGYDHRDGSDRRDQFERRQEMLRREEFARREAFLRHEEWVRAHRFDRPYGYR
jgi:hypothetical protein